jgi:UPF0755 protein
MRRLVVVLALLGLVVPAASAAPTPKLHVIFDEGLTVRGMVNRAAAVRGIAIRTRHVTPALTGKAYAKAVAAAKPPAGFGRPRSLEGFLFPDTYEFGPATRAAEIVALQQRRFAQQWAKVKLPAGRKPYDVLIVASMVERETAVASERPLVAAVIWNRLDRGMPLGIDATLRYGLGIQGTKAITAKQQQSDSRYNTNRFEGLPPTPIGNPGLASMRAAARPAAVDYVYYVRIPDTKTHFFTADEAEFCAKALEFGYRGC